MYCVVLAMVYSCVCVSACVNYLCGYVPYVVPICGYMCGVCMYGILSQLVGILSTGTTCTMIICLCSMSMFTVSMSSYIAVKSVCPRSLSKLYIILCHLLFIGPSSA